MQITKSMEAKTLPGNYDFHRIDKVIIFILLSDSLYLSAMSTPVEGRRKMPSLNRECTRFITSLEFLVTSTVNVKMLDKAP